MAERKYAVIDEGQKIVEALCQRYPKELWQVRPNQVAVLGIENKEPTKRSPAYKVRAVKNAEKAIFRMNNVKVAFIIETFYSLWNQWDTPKREWIIFDALLRVTADEGKLLRPDSVEFKIVLDQVGFDWKEEGAALPSLTAGNPVEFNLDLRPGLDEENENDDGNDDD